MNTKFDVGQRVTYPIVQTADGSITGIAVSEAGVTRYAIGPKWYAEEDLNLAEEKPDAAITATEPVKKSEPVKLYCVGDYNPFFTHGRVYELKGGRIKMDNRESSFYDSIDRFFMNNASSKSCLVPLVRRPAKVGEWVYVLDRGTSRYEEKRIYKVFDTGSNSCVWFADDCKGNIRKENYLVLDGYTGDPT